MSNWPDNVPLSLLWVILVAVALTLLWSGPRLARHLDELADRTGLGKAIVGAVILGGVTSLPGLLTSVAAAWNDYPSLAFSNAVGGNRRTNLLFKHRRLLL